MNSNVILSKKDSTLTLGICRKIIEAAERHGDWFQSGGVGYSDNEWTNQTRTSYEMWVERSGLHWVRDKLIFSVADVLKDHPATKGKDDLYFYESRIVRYEEGQFLKPHRDNPHPTPYHLNKMHGGKESYYHDGKNKLLTFIIYLNDDYEGGELHFNEIGRSIKPKAGDLLAFPPLALHEGKTVTKGTKYILISSVLVPDAS